MTAISIDQIEGVALTWDIYRGMSHVREDFSLGKVWMFARSATNSYALTVTLGTTTDGGQQLKATLPAMEAGTYNFKAIWLRPDTQLVDKELPYDLTKILATQVYDAFILTTDDTEKPTKIELHSHSAAYGYDGLNSWELAVVKGTTTMSENDWVSNLTEMNNMLGSPTDTLAEGKTTYAAYENDRKEKEAARKTAETAREAAETARETAETARQTAEEAREHAEESREAAETAREAAEAARGGQASSDHTQAEADHTQAVADHTTAGADHTTAASDHTTAGTDHTTAAADHTTAETDHTTAAADHEAYGTFDEAPTKSSTNPVTSGGVYEALKGKQDKLTTIGEETYGTYARVGDSVALITKDSIVVANGGVEIATSNEGVGITAKSATLNGNNIATTNDIPTVTQTLTSGTEIAKIGSTTIYAPEGGDGKVKDVQVDGTSVLDGTTGVANIDMSSKQDVLTFDTTPTADSTNPVTSGGIKTELDNKVNIVSGKGLSTNDFTNLDKLVTSKFFVTGLYLNETQKRVAATASGDATNAFANQSNGKCLIIRCTSTATKMPYIVTSPVYVSTSEIAFQFIYKNILYYTIITNSYKITTTYIDISTKANQSEVDEIVSELSEFNDTKADKTEIPQYTHELTNDSGYLTEEETSEVESLDNIVETLSASKVVTSDGGNVQEKITTIESEIGDVETLINAL